MRTNTSAVTVVIVTASPMPAFRRRCRHIPRAPTPDPQRRCSLHSSGRRVTPYNGTTLSPALSLSISESLFHSLPSFHLATLFTLSPTRYHFLPLSLSLYIPLRLSASLSEYAATFQCMSMVRRGRHSLKSMVDRGEEAWTVAGETKRTLSSPNGRGTRV